MGGQARGRPGRALTAAAACALAGSGFIGAASLGPWGPPLFLVAVAGVLGLAVFVVRKQEAKLRLHDEGLGCTTYAKVPGSGTFFLTLDDTGMGLRGSSPGARKHPPEHYPWAVIQNLTIARAGPFGSGGELSAQLPNRVLRASIGRVDEMVAVAEQHRGAAPTG